MFYALNKIVGGVLNPLSIGLLLMAIGLFLALFATGEKRRKLRRWGIGVGFAAFFWLWIWSTQVMLMLFALPLEKEFPIVRAEEAPTCDAIVVLGGGMGANTNVYPYAEMWNGADRVWHAARLYKAGKAPLVIPTGSGEESSTVPLLLDLGVPHEAILVEPDARNTEENAKFVERLLRTRAEAPNLSNASNATNFSNNSNLNSLSNTPKILLVTSAWHMRRSLLMYRRYAPGLEIVPAATDYESTVNATPFSVTDLFPSYDRFQRNCIAFKEYVGYWGYRLLRR